MNMHQVKGAIKEVTGKVQRKFGSAIGSDRLREKGLAKEVNGTSEKKIGAAEEALKEPHRYP